MTYSASTTTFSAPSLKGGETVTIVAKRYVPQTNASNGLTLLCFHCTGSHKESWEPTIQHLLDDTAARRLIREIWAVDNAHSGEAAVHNAAWLSDERIFTLLEWAAAVKAWVASGVFAGHTLVAVGHSGGTCAFAYTMSADEPDGGRHPAVPYAAAILVEPSLCDAAAYEPRRAAQYKTNLALADAIGRRRGAWASRAAARAFFAGREPWRSWDPRVRELFVQCGLKEVGEPNAGERRVVLCCSPKQEAIQYLYQDFHNHAATLLATAGVSVPKHFVLATQAHFIPSWMSQSVMDLCKPASVQRIDAGHFAVQEDPAAVAAAIARVLVGNANIRARM
ncbi:alpha/beta-hydrolase [Epithele typhae]|uniref:alpha/beta-hydrolase n=1 Tax=Epithele typhae TaxID=378194 RepID=UPI00200780E4|nr:alpha/beta-hydrolase [Epithele typhae]KAH9922797.1 alpha/beta-hydrolase [Epithele typhae]